VSDKKFTKLEINKNEVVAGRVKIYLLNQGQVNHLKSIFIPSFKKGDLTKCTKKLHHCNIYSCK
jgi:hypothetical protein